MSWFSRNNKPLFYLYQVYKVAVYYPLLGIGWCIVFSSFMILFFLWKSQANKAAIAWARYSAYITPMLVKVMGLENLDRKQSYVIVANHQSQYDIFVVYGWLPVDFKWVLKIELRKVPVIGPFCYRMEHVFVDRSNHEAAMKAIEEAKARIKGGTSIMFFPEGTRSRTGELLEFKKGAFKFALDIGLPILPITIIGTKDILPDKTTALYPGKALMVIHKPIPIDGYKEKDLEKLASLAKKAIQEGLDRYTPR